MIRETIAIGATRCVAFGSQTPQCVLIQPTDPRDETDRTVELLAEQTDVPFLHIAFAVSDWNRDLSPWEAPPVFGKDAFGSGAKQTLVMLETDLLPQVFARFRLSPDLPVIFGGYSLAALFALWCAYQTDRLAAVVSASPSVWFPGWIDYARTHRPKTKRIDLSLGDREALAKNRVLATVGDCIRTQFDLLSADPSVQASLVWNPGNHFCEPDLRVANGFLRCLPKAEQKDRI